MRILDYLADQVAVFETTGEQIAFLVIVKHWIDGRLDELRRKRDQNNFKTTDDVIIYGERSK